MKRFSKRFELKQINLYLYDYFSEFLKTTELKDEAMIQISDAVLNQLTISQYFKLSFEIWIYPSANTQVLHPIFHSTNEMSKNGQCGAQWPLTEALIQSDNKFSLYHSFDCLDAKGQDELKIQREGKEKLTIGEWHKVEYQQLPIFNDDGTTSLAEIIIRVNNKTTHKIPNRFPKRFDNINVYYGSQQDNDDSQNFVEKGKIKNFKLFQLLKGLYF